MQMHEKMCNYFDSIYYEFKLVFKPSSFECLFLYRIINFESIMKHAEFLWCQLISILCNSNSSKFHPFHIHIHPLSSTTSYNHSVHVYVNALLTLNSTLSSNSFHFIIIQLLMPLQLPTNSFHLWKSTLNY